MKSSLIWILMIECLSESEGDARATVSPVRVLVFALCRVFSSPHRESRSRSERKHAQNCKWEQEHRPERPVPCLSRCFAGWDQQADDNTQDGAKVNNAIDDADDNTGVLRPTKIGCRSSGQDSVPQ